MGPKNEETYWSQFTTEFEEKQSYVVGNEVIALTKEEILKEHQHGKVLELGCGTGLYTETLQRIAEKVVATDLSDEMIAFAKQKRGNLKNVEFKKADALNLEFADENFDTVFMANLIHVVGNAEQVIKESYRVLKKSGLLIVTSFAIYEMSFFNRLTMGIRYLRAFGKPSRQATREKLTRKRVEKLLLDNGFEILKTLIIGKKYKSIYIKSKKK